MSSQNFGDRLKATRQILPYSRMEFAKRHNIPEISLRTWELDKSPISPKYLNRLLEAFHKENIPCTAEWLLTGEGHSPFFLKEVIDKSGENITIHFDELNSPISSFLIESKIFKDYNKDSIVQKINDSYMLPYYHEGDHVGGILLKSKEEIEQAYGKNVIAYLPLQEIPVVRCLLKSAENNKFNLVSINFSLHPHSSIFNTEVTSIYLIKWHRQL